MPRSCVCLSCVLCELVIQDHATRNKSLIHMFNHVVVAGFPTRMHRACVMVSITDGRGISRGRLEILDPENKVVVFGASQVDFTDPNIIIDLCYEFRDIEFHKEGRHIINFWLGGELVVMRPFTVQLHQPGPVAHESESNSN